LKDPSGEGTTDGYADAAADRVKAVTYALSKLEDVHLQAGEDAPLAESLSLAKIAETAAGEAQNAAPMTRMFNQLEIWELKRFSNGPGLEATVGLAGYQKHLEAATQRLAE